MVAGRAGAFRLPLADDPRGRDRNISNPWGRSQPPSRDGFGVRSGTVAYRALPVSVAVASAAAGWWLSARPTALDGFGPWAVALALAGGLGVDVACGLDVSLFLPVLVLHFCVHHFRPLTSVDFFMDWTSLTDSFGASATIVGNYKRLKYDKKLKRSRI